MEATSNAARPTGMIHIRFIPEREPIESEMAEGAIDDLALHDPGTAQRVESSTRWTLDLESVGRARPDQVLVDFWQDQKSEAWYAAPRLASMTPHPATQRTGLLLEQLNADERVDA